MNISHLALVSQSAQLPRSALDSAAAAIQVQVLRDFGPLWGIVATVDAFETLDDVPVTYYPMVVMDHLPVDAAGIHLDRDFLPFALIEFSNRWTLTASHEALEMLADPFGNRLQAADSIKSDQGIVEYLVEVCDPCEAVQFSYLINGVVVSDFYLPSYFDPVAVPGNRYSFTGSIERPLQVAEDGYLSWRDPSTAHWWQQRWFGTPAPTFVDLGVLSGQQSPRRWIDQKIFHVHDEALTGVTAGTDQHGMLAAAYGLAEGAQQASAGHAARLREDIDALLHS
ncbi:hypothetical protein J5X84_27270 [Streptosporangiaceae bacterium NEAU-GS5]|nr:hypothetical protein [Streptosporangiaceae bacterium NEAU-GS5]